VAAGGEGSGASCWVSRFTVTGSENGKAAVAAFLSHEALSLHYAILSKCSFEYAWGVCPEFGGGLPEPS
jgi:hypothetical protein